MTNLKPTADKDTALRLWSCIILTGLSYLLTPVIIRTIADGVIPTKDLNALAFLMVTVVLVEVFGTGSTFLFKETIERNTRESIRKMKTDILTKVSERRAFLNSTHLSKLIQKDVSELNHYLLRQKWLDYQDGFLVLLLMSAAVIINFRFGFLISLIILLNQLVHIGIYSVSKAKINQSTFFDADEHSVLQNWIRNLTRFWDRREAREKLEPVLVSMEKIVEKGLELSRLQSLGDAITRGSKMVAVALAILVMCSEPGASQTAGTIFALVVIVYRITGPMGRLGRAALSGQRGFSSHTKIRLLLEELDTPPNYEIAKNKSCFSELSKIKLRGGPALYLCEPRLTEKLLDVMRSWEMLFFKNERFIFSTNDEKTSKPGIDLYIQFPASKQGNKDHKPAQAEETNCGLWQAGFPTEATKTPPQVFLVHQDFSGPPKLERIPLQKQLSRETVESIFNIWASWSDDFRFFSRDLERIFKNHTPSVFWTPKHIIPEMKSVLKQRIRSFDFVFELPNGELVFCFFGTDLAGFSKIIKRFEALHVPIDSADLERTLFFENQGDSRPHVLKAKSVIVMALLFGLSQAQAERRAA
jgi:ABC-type multidrug transport system fused ATPase/permease subunit